MARSLSRGLAVLLALNERESATAGELARLLRVPRASLYRVLETLAGEGFVEAHRPDQTWRLTPKVRALGAGFSDDQYLAAVARPELLSITRSLRWPVSFGMLAGTSIVVRASTDDASPLAADRFSIGYRMSVLTTATGLCVLAHLDRPSRDALLAALAGEGVAAVPAGRERTTLEARLREIRNRGFCTLDRRRQSTDATSIAVPVSVPGGPVRGAITLRFAKAALALPVAIASFVPAMREAAHRIAARAGDPMP
jgi:IclR family transcriptional regulator, mhp operon transcriptional activator